MLCHRFDAINGLLVPGGSGNLTKGHPFYDNTEYLLKLAIEANDNGDYFPVGLLALAGKDDCQRGQEALDLAILMQAKLVLWHKGAGHLPTALQASCWCVKYNKALPVCQGPVPVSE